MGKDKSEGSDIYRSVEEVRPGAFTAVVTIQVAGFTSKSEAEDAPFALVMAGSRQFRRLRRQVEAQSKLLRMEKPSLN